MDQGTVATVMAALTQRTQGAAAAFGTTLKGRLDIAGASLENVGIKIGLVLVPYLEKAGVAVANLIGWFQKHSAVAKVLAGIIGGILVGSIIKFAVETAGTAVASVGKFVTSLLGMGATAEASGAETTLAFGPIGIALVAVGIAAYELYKHWNTVWSFIKQIAGGCLALARLQRDPAAHGGTRDRDGVLRDHHRSRREGRPRHRQHLRRQ